MLGRLARWLRLLGHDVVYHIHLEDSLLLRIAREEERALLTRDTRLVQVRGLKNFLLLRDNNPFVQLKEVIEEFGLSPFDKSCGMSIPISGGRCSICNTALEDVSKEQAKAGVPKYVFDTAAPFRRCPECKKFYWKGTHQQRFAKKLREIL